MCVFVCRGVIGNIIAPFGRLMLSNHCFFFLAWLQFLAAGRSGSSGRTATRAVVSAGQIASDTATVRHPCSAVRFATATTLNLRRASSTVPVTILYHLIALQIALVSFNSPTINSDII